MQHKKIIVEEAFTSHTSESFKTNVLNGHTKIKAAEHLFNGKFND